MHLPWQVDCLVFAAVFNLGLVALVRTRLRVAAANSFALGLLLAVLWAADYAVDLRTGDLASKIELLRLRFLFLPFYGLVWYETAHRYALGRRFLYGRRLGWTAVVPIVTVLLLVLPLPGSGLLFRNGFRVETQGGLSLLRFSLGPWGVITVAYILGFFAAAVWVLWRTRDDTPWDRGAHQVMIAACLLGVSCNALFLLGRVPPAGLNYGPIVSPIVTGLVTLAMWRGRIFALAPVARAALVENLAERLVVLDGTGRVVDLNRAAARALGAAPERLAGRPATAALAPWPEVVAALDRHTAGKTEVRIGAESFELTVLAVGERPERPLARILTLRDVTERRRNAEDLRRAKEAAEAAAEAKNRFLSTMSHEVRTPLNQVLGFAQLLQATSLDAEQREFLDHIDRGGQSLLGIVEGMLEFVQITSSDFALREAACVLRELVTRTCEPLQRLAGVKGLTLRWVIRPEVPEVIQTDPARLGQILAHLVNNAIKFTERGGVEVEIACPAIDGMAAFVRRPLAMSVRDTGIGIAPAAAGRIFEPFGQGDDSLTRRYGGVGLGLPIARRLCELMGGGLTMTSEPGRGSTFTARLLIGRPAVDGDNHPAAGRPETRDTGEPTGSP